MRLKGKIAWVTGAGTGEAVPREVSDKAAGARVPAVQLLGNDSV